MLHAAISRNYLATSRSEYTNPAILSSSFMNPFVGAEPHPNDPIPPTYELSQNEYDTKIADALQQSLYISQSGPPPNRTNSGWQTWDDDAFQAAQAAERQYQAGGSGVDAQRRRVSSTMTFGSGAETKERPDWLGEAGPGGSSSTAGRRSAPVMSYGGRSSSAGLSARPSRSSSQTTSPTEENATRRLNRYLDEEAGIENPPPPFAAPNGYRSGLDRQGSSGSSYALDSPPPPPSAYRASPQQLPTRSSPSPNPRLQNRYSDLPQPRVSPTPPPLHNRHSLPVPPPGADTRHRRSSFSPQANSGPARTLAPRIAFDPAVAYESPYATFSPGPAAAASFYR